MTWLIERRWVSAGALELLFPVPELGVGGLVAHRRRWNRTRRVGKMEGETGTR